MLLREVQYARPGTVEEAVGLSSAHDGARPLAGGQTLVNVMKARAASPDVLVDLHDLDELRGVRASRQRLGRDRRDDDVLATRRLDRGRGRALDPRRGRGDDRRRPGAEPRHGRRQRLLERPDEPPAAALRRARTRRSRSAARTGERTVPADEFFLGVYMTAVGPGELLTRINVPRRRRGDGFAALTIGTRRHGHRHRRRLAQRRARGSRSAASTRCRCGDRDGGAHRLGLLRGRRARRGRGPRRDARSAGRRARARRTTGGTSPRCSLRAPCSAARERRVMEPVHEPARSPSRSTAR